MIFSTDNIPPELNTQSNQASWKEELIDGESGRAPYQVDSLNCSYVLYKKLFISMIIICIISFASICTWALFVIFPTLPKADSVTTVFSGVFGIIAGTIGLYKLLN
jgi:hypothetical protein